jgi:transcriptional regulator with XRE-family HTH domain
VVHDSATATYKVEPSSVILRKNLKHYLRQLGYSTFELFAHESNVPKSTLSQILNMTRDPRLSTLDALAKAMHIHVSKLLELPKPLPPDWSKL